MKSLQNICLYLVWVIVLSALVFGQAGCTINGGCRTKASGPVWSFEQDKIGSIPEGWKVAETNGRGKTATWEIVSDGAGDKKAAAITQTRNTGQTYNLLIAKNTNYKDLKIKLKVRAISGTEDQGGGPIWRARDADNYYICRWNPLEKNFRVYFVKDSRRKRIASAKVDVDPKTWHKIEIEHVGSKIIAKFNGQRLIEVKDSTFTEAGMVGLWTKADAATAFDDFRVKEAD